MFFDFILLFTKVLAHYIVVKEVVTLKNPNHKKRLHKKIIFYNFFLKSKTFELKTSKNLSPEIKN